MLIEIWAYRGLGGESESMTQKIFGSRSIVKYEQFKYKQIVIKKKRIKIKINNISYQIQILLIKKWLVREYLHLHITVVNVFIRNT